MRCPGCNAVLREVGDLLHCLVCGNWWGHLERPVGAAELSAAVSSYRARGGTVTRLPYQGDAFPEESHDPAQRQRRRA